VQIAFLRLRSAAVDYASMQEKQLVPYSLHAPSVRRTQLAPVTEARRSIGTRRHLSLDEKLRWRRAVLESVRGVGR